MGIRTTSRIKAMPVKKPRSEKQVPPARSAQINETAHRCRKTVMKRALITASAAVSPVPGIDLVVDLGVLMKLLREINAEFGLTPEQIEDLAPKRRLSVYRAIAAVGSSVIGRAVTREALAVVMKGMARRVATKSTVKYLPVAGQAMAATLSFTAVKYVGYRHIDDCVAVAEIIAGHRSHSGAAH
jgi:uncharacterized protein (DUF697 family)